MTTYKWCTSCKREKKITKFRKRKKQGKRPGVDPRIATCMNCEQTKYRGLVPPPKKVLKPRVPYAADPNDPDVIRFREEMERRGA